MSKKVIIIGGVAGGASAAARLRRLDETAEIIMLERGEHISFANCGLPYYIGGTIKERSKLLVQTPEMMKKRFNIDVRTRSEAVSVNTAARTVTVHSAEQGTYEETFDQLILSPGAKPIRPKIPGIGHPRITTLRSIPDTDRIKALVDEEQVRRVTVIGGGFIGVEMTEVLRERGLDVTLVEAAPHLLAPFDADMVTLAEKELEDHGVRLILGTSVEAFRAAEDGGLHVELSGREAIPADLVILSIGVVPETAFLKDTGIELGPRGHIRVDAHMRTTADGIYAVGDAVEVADFVSGSPVAIPLAGPANKQGRIAADHLCGMNSHYRGSQGTSILKVFGLTGASTGMNERALAKAGTPYHTVTVHPGSHAGYYPGASPITLKLIFDREGAILGAQAFGRGGTDKRIDVIAAVMRLKGTVYDLAELELAYAPPYSSAKDPVNMAGFVAVNALQGLSPVITAAQLAGEGLPEEALLIDVRTPGEFAKGCIPGAVNIPVDDLRGRLDELDRSREIVVYCQVGLRGYTASRILIQNGFSVLNLTGGYRSYEIAGYRPAGS
ncbi:FAD-dependent oxidoreductase [Paenibacillus lutrae]|uniref:CoA-disulfide reductase n=1 Tax=Paenibacillus lutrae TaxID=2078573 RepID=A0A7X3FFZ0_9BACL|nr:FAD-dependent oxidoreductase [Paenibacillus lutrae]MVO98773.1 CoA-disulfide reductase [Paenibacillus lutrae]